MKRLSTHKKNFKYCFFLTHIAEKGKNTIKFQRCKQHVVIFTLLRKFESPEIDIYALRQISCDKIKGTQILSVSTLKEFIGINILVYT